MNFSINNTAKDGFAFSLLCVGTLAVAVILSACGGGNGGNSSYPLAFLPAAPPAGSGSGGDGPSPNVKCKDFDGNDVTVKPKTITVYNNSDRVIYPVLSTSENSTNQWIQGCFRVDDKPFPTSSVYKLYVNEGTGIPANSSVQVTLPLYSELSTDNYITWWNGGRVVLADSNERLRQDEDKKLDTPGAVTCQGQNTQCALSVYSSKVQFPENIYAQLSEYTFGDMVIPDGQKKPLLKPDNVGYNISYVDHVYLPIGIGPKNNPYIGYSGSVQPLTTFASAIGAFMGSDAGKGWPVYNLNSLKLPGGYNIFAQRTGVLPATDNVPVKPASSPPVLTVQKCIAGQCTEDEKQNLHYGEAVQRMQNLWGSCVNWGAENISQYVTETVACPANLAANMNAVKQFFAQNHKNYLALHIKPLATCKTEKPEKPDFTYMEALKHIYGWVPFNEGCGAGDNKLAATVIPGWTHATIQPMYIHDLQYNYKQAAVKNDPKLNFNPYVSLIHEDLQMNAYGFSVDDAVGFMSELGDGLVFVVGGPKGLENPKQFSFLDGFALAIGVPLTVGEGTPLIKKYGACALNQDVKDPSCDANKQDVTMPTNSRIAGFRVGSVPSYPVKVRFTDMKDNLYTFQVIDRFAACAVGAPGGDCPSNKAAIEAGLSCSVTRSDGTVHPKSKTWCDGANPNQSREEKDPQVTKNFMSFPVPVDYLP
jgi:hypothetical protein